MATFGVRVFCIILLLLACQTLPIPAAYSENIHDEAAQFLRQRIESADTPPKIVAEGEILLASEAVTGFYQGRAFQPAWIGADGPSHLADSLLEALHGAEAEGLKPHDYHLARIETLLAAARQKPQRPEALADLDLLLTDAYLLYASHLLAGHVNPETLQTEWHISRTEADPAAILRKALESGDIKASLTSLLPADPAYGRLKEALAHYREIRAQGGWPPVPDGPMLRTGDTGPRVAALRARLVATADLDADFAQGEEFDEEVEEAVFHFQLRHGLDPDGAVGPQTLVALNVPVEEREKQIVVNLERRRWLPAELGSRYILVNVADFRLEVVDGGKVVLEMKAIVGRPYRQTPSFTATMTHLVFSPYWNIPHSIAVKDLLPKIQKDRRFLAKEKIRVFRGWGANARQIDPWSINWRRLSEDNFPYRLRQDPGPRNSLGRVKFMLPNRFDVYIHDTPSRELFEMAVRGFSSGCIRIDKPVELAEYLLADDPSWPQEKILELMEQQREKRVRLARPITVYFLYWTAWVDRDGVIQFRDDLYSRDALVSAALDTPPPSP
ncbi:L,D-transpeptidase family protein [Geobacter grbiciae]|uniref:L,D-transpeptidase family protein n=1 Tax=Geobacter grbiciae TaxID=155042 RepID=UPI001FEB9C74|nr:L,D-transpeptidase family protein [Geobacter grbiciae]